MKACAVLFASILRSVRPSIFVLFVFNKLQATEFVSPCCHFVPTLKILDTLPFDTHTLFVDHLTSNQPQCGEHTGTPASSM